MIQGVELKWREHSNCLTWLQIGSNEGRRKSCVTFGSADGLPLTYINDIRGRKMEHR